MNGDDRQLVQELVGVLRGPQLGELEAALADNRDGVVTLAEKIARSKGLTSPPAVFVSAMRRGEHKTRRMTMSDEEGTGPKRPPRVPAAEAMRRLYEAKIGDLARYRIPEADRIRIAVDYACSEVHRCSIEPMPPGGVVALEDALYKAVGFDRTTGLRYPPETRA